MRKLALIAALFLLPLATFAQSAADVNKSIDANLGDHTQYQALFTSLQKGVATHDAAAVAALISYPITIKINGHAVIFRTPRQFIASYDQVFTPAITKAVTDQKYADLFVNAQGIMLGNGQIWLNGVCVDYQCRKMVAKVRTIQDTSDIK